MFGFDWPELIIIGIVALIFIGPEDLPAMFRQLGRFTAKLRQMSREFSRAMEQAAKETGVSDVARDLKTSTSVKSLGLDKMREAADKFEKWDPLKNAAKPTATMPARTLTPPPMPATPAPKPAVPDEVEDDIAAVAEADAASAPKPVEHGPATQALYDKQALRAKVLAEQTEKLKAIEAGTYAPPAEATSKPAPRKRTPKPKADVDAALATNVPTDPPKKTTRKKKADLT
jgi:sec-independent protein translocase protein TatB